MGADKSLLMRGESKWVDTQIEKLKELGLSYYLSTPFHLGAFMAAAEAGLSVVPIAIRGTRSILRADSWFPRRGAITITIGGAIETEELLSEAGGDIWRAALKLRSEAREHVLRYCGEPDLASERSPI